LSSPHNPSSQSHSTNRLANETSPYLLQHQHNPVDWYAWGPEAFKASREQDKPIFLSVGYSTCYWCHVMERQSFENDAIAAVMNEHFVNVKVDREERPDVDQLYMTAVQVLTRHGGWPMSVFLTPDLKPFFGGTYFPPEDAYGRPGFPTLLRGISDAYRNRRGDVEQSADQLVNILEQLARPRPPSHALRIDDKLIDRLVEQSASDYEPRHGGFGAAPKFPRETLLELLLTYCAQPVPKSAIGDRQSAIMKRLRHTLDAMANGGIRDHLGGGFHRYSTDAQWLVPHFEIMLYDNAMLAWCYVDAYRQTEEQRYARVARGVFDFVLREMTSPDGAFYTAFDAEVDAQEGLSYLWTPAEVNALLEDFENGDGTRFLRMYGLDRGANFADPHHGTGTPDKNILFLPDGPEQEDDPTIARMRQVLYEARLKRKQPLLDTKVITSWNALMIRALAYGGQVLSEPRYIEAAERAARLLLDRHCTDDGGLYRASRDGAAKYRGFLDDYAFLAQALLALRDASGRDEWAEHAATVATTMRQRFGDGPGGFYFTEESAQDLIVRQMVAADSPLPAGNAVAAMVMQQLDQPDVARQTIETFAGQIESNPEGMSSMVQAAMLYLRQHREPITVEAGAAEESESDRPLSPPDMALRVVSVSAGWHDPKLLEMRLQVLRSFHINSNQPAAGMIPTELRPIDATEVESIEYPPGEERALAFADEPVRVYEGDVRLLIRFKTPKTGQPRVRFGLYYQACDDNACLPPVTKQLEVPTP
jgi:uncharacterized protein YyaL (SSP411 family)